MKKIGHELRLGLASDSRLSSPLTVLRIPHLPQKDKKEILKKQSSIQAFKMNYTRRKPF